MFFFGNLRRVFKISRLDCENFGKNQYKKRNQQFSVQGADN